MKIEFVNLANSQSQCAIASASIYFTCANNYRKRAAGEEEEDGDGENCASPRFTFCGGNVKIVLSALSAADQFNNYPMP